ncbi:MAG: DUF4129 domain-containing protein [Acidimicrobiales bacterium]
MALLVMVVVTVAADGGETSSRPSEVVGQALGRFFLAGFALLVAVGAWLWWLRLRHHESGPRRARRPAPPWWLRSLVALSVLLICVLVFSWAGDRTGGPPVERVTSTTVTRPGAAAGGGCSSGVSSAIIVGVLVAIVVAAVVLARIRHRLLADTAELAETDDQDVGEEGGVALRGALAGSIVDLESVLDPRVAVIAAYVRMQTVLAEVGTARRPTETELEFLGRVLARLGGGGEPARALTDLFALARYSDHPIDDTMRAEALAAVRQLQTRLMVAP